ncbi:MAG TPA: quinolinate synthase NadA [Candidatus Poseidoniales archaeon]|nr:MAG: quinolinate synthase [Euryarchaeota archaeon]PXY76505.1 MAG: quinolinate synthase [Euryarchaeota archaeon]HIA89942.1 quinolinate synthase NadA [Candidatus Poseidoniales archaeon]HIB59620.1 quinolinate synthase NadA [Candidatus Poseidoniales archaeon]HIO94368.1 quinolinate synthase NadA [Candidatus Poseidoniales archaeon]
MIWARSRVGDNLAISLPLCEIDPLSRSSDLSEQDITERIAAAKQTLGEKLLILGHHYQRDSIVAHADLLGDSFLLSKQAAESSAEYIVFCGVHFMAESADILTSDNQKVVLPNLRAGCSMADMANVPDVQQCWDEMLANLDLVDPAEREDAMIPASEGEAFLIPVTYMNSSAELKAFVGQHGGVVCTSSNAAGVLSWAFERAGKKGKVLFFPDQHLGRNTGLAMGLSVAEMAVWQPGENPDWQALEGARIVLWHGYCSVHRRFSVEQIEGMRLDFPDCKIVVHPECRREVVEASDAVGSTEFIRNYVAQQDDGVVIGVGTEINMVKRLNQQYPDKQVICLDPLVCPCSTMYMIHPIYLLDVLERIIEGEVPNHVTVPNKVSQSANLALQRMLQIPI